MANQLSHFGIPGMRWGHRKSQAQQAHESKVRSLKTQIKQKSNSRWDAEQKRFQKDESAAYARINALEKKKLAAHDKQAKNAFDRALGSGLIKMNARIDRSNVVSRLEDKMIKADDARSKAKWKEQAAILKKWDKKADAFFQSKVKGLPFPKDLVAALQADKEMGRQITEELLKSELRHA